MDTVEGATFTLRYLLAITAISGVVGVIYATGIAGNDPTFGILLLALSVPMLFLCWRIVRVRRRLRARKDEPRHSLP